LQQHVHVQQLSELPQLLPPPLPPLQHIMRMRIMNIMLLFPQNIVWPPFVLALHCHHMRLRKKGDK